MTYPNPVRTQLEIHQVCQIFQAFNLRYLVLHKVNVVQFLQVIHSLDMLDLVVTQVQAAEFREWLETLYV